MKPKLLLTGAGLLAVALCLSSGCLAQLPPHAVVYLDTFATFQGQPAPLRVVFYEVRGESIGVMILGADGHETAHATENLTLGLYKGTGVYDVTGDGWPEVVMIGVAGAKTLGATIYDYRDGRLREIGRTSGFSVKIVHLHGRPVIATNGEYGTLSDLLMWQEGKFVEANERFPEYYRSEIAQQKRILDSPAGFPVYVIPQACELGARALVYGKNYEDARKLCVKALDVARWAPGLIANQIGASSEVLAEQRKQAERDIERTLGRITKAQAAAFSQLPN